MASSADTGKQAEAAATGPREAIRRLLSHVVGAEIGVFAPGQRDYPATCRRSCAEAHGRDVCSVVRALQEGELRDPARCPPCCELGHSITLHAETASNAAVLVLRPRPVEAGDLSAPPGADRLKAAGELWDHCQRLIEETSGLANEVIRSYEQLNVLFDVTQEICKSQDAAQIKLFLIRRLAETLDCDWSFCLSPNDGTLWWSRDPAKDREQVIQSVQATSGEAMEEIRERRTTRVENQPCESCAGGQVSLMFATLLEGRKAVDVLVFGRCTSRVEFTSGDMMMLDSVLNHAQHVIANLRLSERLKTMSFEAVHALTSAIDKKDRYTCGHSERVGLLSRLIGEELGLPPEQLQDLEWGGVLHDVGKIGIQDGVLTKPGKLTDEEFEHIKQHVIMSHDIVAPMTSFESIRHIVLYHHETPDGTGYPKGLKGDEIPLPAQIVHVADTFDALTSTRSYRPAFSLHRALEIMEQDKGTKLETSLVDAFKRAFHGFRTGQPARYQKIFGHVRDEEAH